MLEHLAERASSRAGNLRMPLLELRVQGEPILLGQLQDEGRNEGLGDAVDREAPGLCKNAELDLSLLCADAHAQGARSAAGERGLQQPSEIDPCKQRA
jgi:hypothetical protein